MTPNAVRKSMIVGAAYIALRCTAPVPEPSAAEPQDWVADLTAVEGEFIRGEDPGSWSYSAPGELETIIQHRDPHEAVARLVQCLDDASPSRSTIEGKPVTLGIVCYQALSQTAYYEPTGPSGDIAADWPGHIAPDASRAALQAAKQAWLKVVEDKSYLLL